MIKHKALIFDLDGTLIDSIAINALIINKMISSRGALWEVSPTKLHSLISIGGEAMIASALDVLSTNPAAEIREFRGLYGSMATPPDSLFPGVLAGLSKLSKYYDSLSICSNKPQHLCEKVVNELMLNKHFQCIVGASETYPRKPDPHMMNMVLQSINLNVQDCCYIGDSKVDIDFAANCGMDSIYLRHGYGEIGLCGSYATLNNFEELCEFLL